MATTNKERWQNNYGELLAYVKEFHHLPDKKKTENRRLLNWWKYNKKCAKEGKLNTEKINLLRTLSEMREVTVIKF